MWVQSLGGEDPLEEEMAPHSRILAWRIPRTEEPGGCSPWGFRESDTPERLGRATPQPITGKASCWGWSSPLSSVLAGLALAEREMASVLIPVKSVVPGFLELPGSEITSGFKELVEDSGTSNYSPNRVASYSERS